jgi:integrase
MRVSEILSLSWDCVDLKKKQITVHAKSSKSGKQRLIPINISLYKVLNELKGKNCGNSKHVFLYEDPRTGKLRPITMVRNAFNSACKRAGIKNLHFHDLRHTFGSRLIENGADPISVKDLLGHANLKTTEVYLHSSLKRMREAVSLLDQKPDIDAKIGEKLLHICNISNEQDSEKLVNAFFSVN